MPLPKAILFDLDDTLISFEGVTEKAWEKCCLDFIRSHSLEITSSDLLKEINNTRKWYWGDPERHRAGRANIREARREVVMTTLLKFGITDFSLACELADNYSSYHKSLICLLPNTIETLSKLKAKGYRLGMITNGTTAEQRAKIERFSLGSFFEIILIEQETGFGKPDIRIYELALKLLSLPAREIWMVGDNLTWDIEAPKSMGIYSVWLDAKKSGLPSDASTIPDIEIRDISELLSEL